ncbi:MAG: oligosaccharide flippase family protein [Burkholderiales bacterium]
MFIWFKKRFRLLLEHQSTLSVSYLVYTVALGFSGVIQLGLLFFLARVLPAPEFGVVALLMVSIPLVGRLVTSGSDIALAIRIWRRSRIEQQADLGAVLGWTGVLVAILVCFVVIGERLVDLAISTPLVLGTLLTAYCRSYSDIFQVMLRREGRVARVGIFVIVRAAFFGGFSVAAVLLFGASAELYLAGVLSAEAVMALFALAGMRAIYRVSLLARGSFNRMRELVRVGFPSIPGAAATLLLAAGDRFVITGVLGLVAAGIYTLGQRLAEYVVQILFVPFLSAFSPYAHSVASQNQQRAFAVMGQTALAFAFLGGVVAGFPAIFGREAIMLLAGPEFADAVTVFILVLAAALICQLCQILAGYFTHTEQLRKYMWIIVGAAVANLLLNMVSVRVFGIIGAAIVSVLVYEGILISILIMAKSGGVILTSTRRLHIPLFAFFGYLFLIHAVDASHYEVPTRITMKSSLWIAYAILCVAISPEVRDLVYRLSGRVRQFLWH